MLTWLIVLLVLMLIIAPLRRGLLGKGAWRFTLPALAGLAGAWAGWSYMRTMPALGSFGYLSIVVPVLGALVVAGAISTALNDVFGPPGGRR